LSDKKMARSKNEPIRKIMGVEGKPDNVDIENKVMLRWIRRADADQGLLKIIMQWVPPEK
jgi:hypothetical protein